MCSCVTSEKRKRLFCLLCYTCDCKNLVSQIHIHYLSSTCREPQVNTSYSAFCFKQNAILVISNPCASWWYRTRERACFAMTPSLWYKTLKFMTCPLTLCRLSGLWPVIVPTHHPTSYHFTQLFCLREWMHEYPLERYGGFVVWNKGKSHRNVPHRSPLWCRFLRLNQDSKSQMLCKMSARNCSHALRVIER